MKTITRNVPEWIDEEKLRDAIIKAIEKSLSRKRITIDELRKILGIKPEDLSEDLEGTVNVEELRRIDHEG